MTTAAVHAPTHLVCATPIERFALRLAERIQVWVLAHMARRRAHTDIAAWTLRIQREELLCQYADARRDATAGAHAGLLP